MSDLPRVICDTERKHLWVWIIEMDGWVCNICKEFRPWSRWSICSECNCLVIVQTLHPSPFPNSGRVCDSCYRAEVSMLGIDPEDLEVHP